MGHPARSMNGLVSYIECSNVNKGNRPFSADYAKSILGVRAATSRTIFGWTRRIRELHILKLIETLANV